MYIYLKLDILDKMIITSLESTDNLGRSEKRLITSLSLKANVRPKKCKKVRYAKVNISENDLLKIIMELDKVTF